MLCRRLEARGKHVCAGRSARHHGPICPAAAGEEEDMSRLGMVLKGRQQTGV